MESFSRSFGLHRKPFASSFKAALYRFNEDEISFRVANEQPIDRTNPLSHRHDNKAETPSNQNANCICVVAAVT